MIRLATILLVLIVAACSPPGSPHPPPASSSTPSASPRESSPTTGPFTAEPNFEKLAACQHPCWLPLYPTPKQVGGQAVNSRYPSEAAPGHPGDVLYVVCQVKGQVVHNDDGTGSDVWDKVVITPEVRGRQVLIRRTGLKPTPDHTGYYAFGPDIWLGNTGDKHNIPCN